jgi:hypothetical protein
VWTNHYIFSVFFEIGFGWLFIVERPLWLFEMHTLDRKRLINDEMVIDIT